MDVDVAEYTDTIPDEGGQRGDPPLYSPRTTAEQLKREYKRVGFDARDGIDDTMSSKSIFASAAIDAARSPTPKKTLKRGQPLGLGLHVGTHFDDYLVLCVFDEYPILLCLSAHRTFDPQPFLVNALTHERYAFPDPEQRERNMRQRVRETQDAEPPARVIPFNTHFLTSPDGGHETIRVLCPHPRVLRWDIAFSTTHHTQLIIDNITGEHVTASRETIKLDPTLPLLHHQARLAFQSTLIAIAMRDYATGVRRGTQPHTPDNCFLRTALSAHFLFCRGHYNSFRGILFPSDPNLIRTMVIAAMPTPELYTQRTYGNWKSFHDPLHPPSEAEQEDEIFPAFAAAGFAQATRPAGLKHPRTLSASQLS